MFFVEIEKKKDKKTKKVILFVYGLKLKHSLRMNLRRSGLSAIYSFTSAVEWARGEKRPFCFGGSERLAYFCNSFELHINYYYNGYGRDHLLSCYE